MIHDEYAERLETLFGTYDVLALPSAQMFPFPKDWRWPKEVGGAPKDTYHRWMQVCVPVTLGGLPCSTIPEGFGENGLTLGIQLFTRRGGDAKTLLLAQAYHRIVDWPSCVKPSEDDNSLLSCCADVYARS
jgi:amidase